MKQPRYLTRLEQIPQLSEHEREQLRPVIDKFAFRANDYYLSLIDWSDPNDPIRRIIMPQVEELNNWGDMDASGEHCYVQAPGLEHKYEFTALLLVNDVCGGFCRFCFRKRLFMNGNDEVVRDVSPGLEYIRENPQLNNILLTGGDPLLMSTSKLSRIIEQLRQIDHVQIVRIGTKMPAFNPYRIIEDPSLLEMISRFSTAQKRIYIMAHFNHPRELTPQALEGLDLLNRAGAMIINQTPLIRGVNDDPVVLGELFNKLSYAGVPPYYLFQCRPTKGNLTFAVPIEEGFEIFEKARMLCSGLAKRARFVMSHTVGKIEIMGKTEEHMFFRLHRAADFQQKARMLIYESNPRAYWLDDYDYLVDDSEIENPFLVYGT